jgi:hypothetical protein
LSKENLRDLEMVRNNDEVLRQYRKEPTPKKRKHKRKYSSSKAKNSKHNATSGPTAEVTTTDKQEYSEQNETGESSDTSDASLSQSSSSDDSSDTGIIIQICLNFVNSSLHILDL